MSIFDSLPTVDKGCFCIDLKVACFLIGIFTLLSHGALVTGESLGKGDTDKASQCLNKSGDFMKSVVDALFYIRSALYVALCIASVIFLIGLCCNYSWTNTIFMWCLALVTLVGALIVIILLITLLIKGCSFPFLTVVWEVVVIALCIYFLIIVKSYAGSD